MKKLLMLLAMLPLICTAAENDVPTVRSRAVAARFQRIHPCPATGHRYGGCAGYVRDHVIPLACGGPDTVQNMQWQTVAAGKAKDRVERRGCRAKRK